MLNGIKAAFAQSTAPVQKLTVHYLDVGQADSILIQSPAGKTMLIDGGNNADSTFIKAYLKKLNIKKLDVVIATHPHEDHIGGMTAIVNAYTIGKIYMPKAVTTTKTYKDLLTAIKAKGLKDRRNFRDSHRSGSCVEAYYAGTELSYL